MKYKFLILLLLLMTFCQAAEVLMTFERQSGGLTGQYSMLTTDGTLWESSNPVYSNSNYYYMQYLFDRQHVEAGWGTGWLASNVNTEKSLTVTFTEAKYITKIRSYNIMHPGYYNDAHLSTSSNGTNFTQRGDIITGTHYNDVNYYNYYVDIVINDFVKKIRYDFFNITYNGCALLTEMEIYTDANYAIPEPAYLLFLGILIFGIARKMRR